MLQPQQNITHSHLVGCSQIPLFHMIMGWKDTMNEAATEENIANHYKLSALILHMKHNSQRPSAPAPQRVQIIIIIRWN